jgi:hypothetical protein
MNYLGLYILILGLGFSSCHQNKPKIEKQVTTIEVVDIQKDKEGIQKLIRQVLTWSESNESIDLLPVLKDRKGRIYTGFDMNKHKANLAKLRETGFFAKEFIENYNQIILTLDQMLRSKEFDEWFVGDLPPFKFVNEIDPWCLCQDFSPEQFNNVSIVKIDSKSGELIWNWEKGTDWMDFKFMVVKEDNKWKISYMQGFDYMESTKKDGKI